jgi:ATP-GRASP peptide maturase of grasp-with-spasm system
MRVSENDGIKLQSLLIGVKTSNYRVECKGIILDSSSISAVWFRRGGFNLIEELDCVSADSLDTQLGSAVEAQMKDDLVTVNQFILSMQIHNGINAQVLSNVNKLSVLRLAAVHGLLVPDTLITGSRAQLLEFMAEHRLVANKNLNPGHRVSGQTFMLNGITVQLSTADVMRMPERFATALFQAYVEKWVELRIFYLEGTCYSSAIFSQADEKTKIDFRNYNLAWPNRTPPFNLPVEISSKIDRLMRDLNLNSGSIDMIITPALDYYFLEVNPVGQFWQVSHPCNYGLEKAIATRLINGPRNN